MLFLRFDSKSDGSVVHGSVANTKVWYVQVKNKQGQWINADPIPGTFVCNIGDMLKVPSLT